VKSKFHKGPPAILAALFFLGAAVFEPMAATANSFTLDLLWSASTAGALPSPLLFISVMPASIVYWRGPQNGCPLPHK
jgi:hypothetical protein